MLNLPADKGLRSRDSVVSRLDEIPWLTGASGAAGADWAVPVTGGGGLTKVPLRTKALLLVSWRLLISRGVGRDWASTGLLTTFELLDISLGRPGLVCGDIGWAGLELD